METVPGTVFVSVAVGRKIATDGSFRCFHRAQELACQQCCPIIGNATAIDRSIPKSIIRPAQRTIARMLLQLHAPAHDAFTSTFPARHAEDS